MEGNWKGPTAMPLAPVALGSEHVEESAAPRIDAFLLPYLTSTDSGALTRIDLKSLLSRPRVLITGAAGCGKSSMLAAIAHLFRRETRVEPVLMSVAGYSPKRLARRARTARTGMPIGAFLVKRSRAVGTLD